MFSTHPSIHKAFDKMIEGDKKNIKPWYRCKDWNAEEINILNTEKSKPQYGSR